MAVVPSGFFGEYYNQYDRLNSSRNWNTKSYDYAVVKNKGEVSEEGRNEDSSNLNTAADPKLFQKGLYVKTNKNMYVDATGAMVEDKTNPIYQIRDANDRVNNNYYVDQKTGDVYFRPVPTAGNGITLPATTPITREEPQYFGTTFNLERVPNPEEMGQGRFNNITLNVTPIGGTAATPLYSELIVNGVPIQVGNLDTTTINPLATTAANTLFIFSNSFTVDADNFSPVNGTWSHIPATGLYQVAGVGQSGFNQRTLDNFNVIVKIREGAGAGRNAGVHIRANNPEDSVGMTGYFVYLDNAGAVRISKAGYPGGDVPLLAAIPANGGDLDIRMNGTEIIVNGVVAFRDDNETLYGKPYLDGYLSLRSTSGTTKTFDDFEVKSYPTPIQLLSRALKQGENNIVVKAYYDSRVNVNVAGNIRDVRGATNLDIGLSTANLPPNLQAYNGGNPLSITSRFYRDDTVSGNDTYLDDNRAYWSVSQNSALGIAGKIMFVNKEGGGIQKTKDQFMNINTLMQNLTNMLGAEDDLFNSHLGIIR